MEDLYKILGVESTASEEDIKAAYKTLAKKYHPDINKDNPSAEETFKSISAAYDVLKDKSKRNEYDAVRAGRGFRGQAGFGHGGPGGPGGPFGHGPGGGFGGFGINLDELLRQAMGGYHGTGFRPGPQNIHLRYDITLEEAFAGKTVLAAYSLPNGEKRESEITIPAGVLHETNIVLKGQGIKDPTGQAGNVVVRINIKPHRFFNREGQNLYTQIQLDAVDAILGTTVDVPTIEGKNISVTIPKGSQQGDQLRCKGQGFTIHGIPARGDMFVIISNILVPTNITKEQENLLIAYKNLKK